jgi:hypothetical protein
MKARRPKPASSLEKAEWWAPVLKRALEHPIVTEEGCVGFKARVVAPVGQPVSKKCRRLLTSGIWAMEDVTDVVTALHMWIRDARRRG